ncbi:FAD-dependent oxidoreductase [Sandarakinorhabdus sp.]|uniref:FAD-dependent oxidoreductase n=1 Tax=Sandarakinorhabdus sp. TaxID=1916663 RepID=UPI00333E2772
MGDLVQISFEGEPILARAGESVAAALTAHGIRGLRTTRSDADRGLFCGMGVCQDCLVDIDGAPNRRACMTSVAPAMTIRRQRHGHSGTGAVDPRPPATIDDLPVERPELLVIGAGPGGLSAAIAARKAGVEVLVVDERRLPGGQYFKPVAVQGDDVMPPDAQHREGLALVRQAIDAGVVIRSGVTVWGAFKAAAPAAASDGALEFVASAEKAGTMRIVPGAAIIATGAFERAWPVPGWQLPGVMTTGAAQTLWRTARRLPGRRVLIAGNGPLNLQLAAELSGGGAEVVAVIEAAPRPTHDLAAVAAMASASPALVAQGLRYHWQRLRRGVPMLHDHVVHGIAQTADGLRVGLDDKWGFASPHKFDTDVLCLGYGFDPSNDLLRALGCRHDHDPVQNRLVPQRDDDGRTSVAGVYALGDCTGLGGARVAMADGVLAGFAAAADLGHAIGPALARERQAAAAAGNRHRRFQQALWQVYRAPPLSISHVTDDTMICRCEEISFGAARAALADGHIQAGSVKRATRIGMGPCQGRYCRPLLEALITDRCGTTPDEFSGFAPRPPVKPVLIRDLAGR